MYLHASSSYSFEKHKAVRITEKTTRVKQHITFSLKVNSCNTTKQQNCKQQLTKKTKQKEKTDSKLQSNKTETQNINNEWRQKFQHRDFLKEIQTVQKLAHCWKSLNGSIFWKTILEQFSTQKSSTQKDETVNNKCKKKNGKNKCVITATTNCNDNKYIKKKCKSCWQKNKLQKQNQQRKTSFALNANKMTKQLR